MRPDIFDADPSEIMDCHEPRETPLLVDEVTDVLDTILSALIGSWFSYTKLPGRIEDAEAEAQKLIDRAYAVLARYKEEVGDA